MLEPPSPALLAQLYDWQLCQPADIRRARRIVGRLAYDLPAFDSVWIDALVQLGKLTPYQARILESEALGQLCYGRFVLLEELGRSACGTTWLARSLDDRSLSVLKRVIPPVNREEELFDRGRQLMESAVHRSMKHLVAPLSFWDEQGAAFFVSPYFHGVALAELFVRRGRFPAAVVTEIGYQLAAGLAEWHEQQLVHGDVRLSHVRIDARGRAVLVEAGLRLVIEPETTLHTSLSLEAYDGLAPELIGVGHPATASSDLYSLGCVLWQLLAGRPPFSTADPLAKLAAHQTRPIDDVREWAPHTPVALAEAIYRLTRPDPVQRPESAAAVMNEFARQPRAGLNGIRRFRDQFELAVPHLRAIEATSSNKWKWVAAGVAGMAIAGGWIANEDRRADLLSLSPWPRQSAEASDAIPQHLQPDPRAGLMPLPAAGADGVLNLSSPGPYAVGTIRHSGPLTIQAEPGVLPVILVRDEPLRLACERLLLKHICIRRDTTWSSADDLKALVLVHAQHVDIQETLWDLGQPNPRRPDDVPPVGMAWRLVEPLDLEAGTIQVADSVFQGKGGGLFSNQAIRRLQAENVLVLGSDCWLDLQSGSATPTVHADFSQMTFRETGSVVRLRIDPASAVSPHMQVTATNCVVAPRSRDGSLFELHAAESPVLENEPIHWAGESTLVPPDLTLAIWRNSLDSTQHTFIDEVPVNGLLAGRFAFKGLPTMTVADSILGETDIPRRSDRLPGIQLEDFPLALGGTGQVADLPLLRRETYSTAEDAVRFDQ